jgi:hypothetical protein
MAKRDQIAELINAGGATKESLMEAVEVNSAGLSSQFTYLRLTGKYPVKGADDTFSFVTEEEWAVMKADAMANRGGSSAPKKSPEERQEALLKRQAKLQEAFDKKADAFDKDASDINSFRLSKAEAEINICNYELDAVTAELG